MEERLVELKVKVDEDMTVTLKIPTEIEATTLMGMLEKAKRMVKVSLKGETRRIKGEVSHRKLNPAEAKRFIKEYQNAKGKDRKAEVAERYGLNPVNAESKYNYLKYIKKV